MKEEISFVLSDEGQYKFNIGIALELIKKILYKNNDISLNELRSMINIANNLTNGNAKYN